LRILHLVGQLTVGGMESMVTRQVMNLDTGRFDVTVWCLGPGGPNADRLVDAGVAVDVLAKSRGFGLSFLSRLRAMFRDRPFDLVHTHNPAAARWALLGTLGRPRRPVLVRTEHTYNNSKLAGYIPGHAMIGGWFDAIVGVSETTTRAHRRIDPLWSKRYRTIPNGIEVPAGEVGPAVRKDLRRRLGLGEDDRVLVNLGNLRKAKGQCFLLEAFRALSSRHPDLQLVIFGEGDLRSEFERSCREWGLVERVHLVGQRADAADLLGIADIYVQSSLREGMPVSILEAMRACRPIVATDAGGTRELIHDLETGLLVPRGSAESLEQAVERLLEDRDLAAELAESGRKLLVDRYDIRRVAGELETLYETLLDRPGRQS